MVSDSGLSIYGAIGHPCPALSDGAVWHRGRHFTRVLSRGWLAQSGKRLLEAPGIQVQFSIVKCLLPLWQLKMQFLNFLNNSELTTKPGTYGIFTLLVG